MNKSAKKIIGLREFRENTEKFIQAVKKGKSFIIVRKSEPVFKITAADEWGDEGIWETIVNFREIDSKGVSADKILETFTRLKLAE